MLGDKIGEEMGKVTVRRVLPCQGSGPIMETSFHAQGSILGVAHQTTGTYTSTMRPDGSLIGSGQSLS
jgi:hypothetical protein